ncbi:MAG: stage II sporulation protein D [Christensenellales bacterium]
MRRRYAGGGVKPGWIIIAVIAGIMMAAILGKDGQPPKEKAIIELEKQSEGQKEIGPVFINMYNHYDKVIENIELEEYVAGVVSAEMPISFGMEALKAQAVAARTLALKKSTANGRGCAKQKGADICSDSTHCQAWNGEEKRREKWGGAFNDNEARLKKAVEETAGLILEYEEQPIEVFYHSTAGGKTENSENVFSKALPYLVGVDSPGEESAPRYEGNVTVSSDKFVSNIKKAYPSAKISKSDIKEAIGAIVRFESGRVDTITIGGQKIEGTEIRSMFGLNSANFTISFNESGVVFSTKGFGHGVGMSQTGADHMAGQGVGFEEILKHYYTGVEIVKFGG